MAEKVSYAILEMVVINARMRHREIIDATVKIERGLFKGILLRNGKTENDLEKFALMGSLGGKVTALNFNSYNVVALEVLRGRFKETVFYRCTKEDQESAFNNVVDLLADLQATGFVLADEEIVDTSKFTDVPKDLKNSNMRPMAENVSRQPAGAQRHASPTGVGVPSVGAGGYGGHKSSYNNGIYCYNGRGGSHYDFNRQTKKTFWVAEKDRVPKAFKRKSKKPTKKALERMKACVLAIAKGEYEEPQLPKCKGEDAAIEIEATNTWEDDRDLYGCCWG